MDINELSYFQEKLVTLQLKTPWIALMYLSQGPNEKTYAATLAITKNQQGQIEPYGPQQLLPNVTYRVQNFNEVLVEGENDEKTVTQCVVVRIRGGDGSVMEILVPPEEISFVSLITEKPPEPGRIIAP